MAKLCGKPTAAFAAKYCAVTELTRPTAASSTSTPPIFHIYGLSEAVIPLSMIAAMTSGTISSNDASSSLNNGAQMHSFLYSFKYFNICFIFSPFRFYVADYSFTIIDDFSHIYKKNDTLKTSTMRYWFHISALMYMLLDCFKALRTDDMLYTACVLCCNLLIYAKLLKTL